MFSTAPRLLAVAALVCSSVAAVAPPVEATVDGWDPPVILDGPADVAVVDVVVAPDGDMTAAWTNGSSIQVATRPAGEDWQSHPTLVARASSAQLEVDGDGVVHLVWSRGGQVLERRSTPAGWSAPRVVLQRPTPVLLADYDVNKHGAALVAALVPARNLVVTKRRTAAGPWSTATRWKHAARVDLELGDGGQAAVLVNRFRPEAAGSDFGTLTFEVVRGRSDGGWGAPQVLYRDPDAGPPWPGMGGVAVDRRGTTTVTWHTLSHAIKVARATRGGRWQTPELLARPTRDLNERSIRTLATPAGVTLVVFVRRATTVRAALRPVGGPWTAAVRVAPAESFISDWDVALGPGGQAIAVWTACRQPGTGCRAVRASLLDPDGTWSDAVKLSNGRIPDGRALAVALAHREAVVQWLQLATGSVDARVHIRTWSGRRQ